MLNRMIALAVAACLLTCVSSARAAITPYSQDFEGLNMASPTALGDEGWLVGANVFDPTGSTFLYNYFAFPAPNGGPAFSSITTGEGGPPQGDQQLVTYNDYNNGDHSTGNQIEANFFREYTIDASNLGETWTFEFDAKLGDLVQPTEALAFIKVLDPNNGYSLSAFPVVDTAAIPTTWGTYSISQTIDTSWTGQIFQIGFLNTTSNFTPSGVVYDNINFTPEPTSLALLGAGLLLVRRRR